MLTAGGIANGREHSVVLANYFTAAFFSTPFVSRPKVYHRPYAGSESMRGIVAHFFVILHAFVK